MNDQPSSSSNPSGNTQDADGDSRALVAVDVIDAHDGLDGFERVERFQALEPGSYWRYNGETTRDFESGVVLLLLDIETVDGAPHTVNLRSHPRARYEGTHAMLVPEFLADWEFEPDGEAVRQRELQGLQDEIADLQAELIEGQSNPLLLTSTIEEALKSWEDKRTTKAAGALEHDQGVQAPEEAQGPAPQSGSTALAAMRQGGRLRTDIGAVIDNRLSNADVQALAHSAERELVITEAKSTWLQSRVTSISNMVTQMAPFFAERSAVALAKTADVRKYVKDVLAGIRSLRLYTGEGVEVVEIAQGDSAPPDVPLSLMQAKLFMDEELAAWADVGEDFDFTKVELFDEKLASSQSLCDQIFPTRRCVVSMAIRRRDFDYGHAHLNERNNEINRSVFLMVRDGDNVYRVYSSEETHELAKRLFPAKGEHDEVFRGLDGTQINFNNIQFAEKTRKAQDLALHYKRFLILLCGLDHRRQLFGRFYDEQQSLSFISMEFQAKYLNFIHDDERGQLLGEGRPTVGAYIEEQNAYLQSGSRVLCWYPGLLTTESAPSTRKEREGRDRDYVDVLASPKVDHEVKVVYKDGQDLCIDVLVKRESAAYKLLEQPTFNARVKLGCEIKGAFGYLCLDAINPRDLDWYVHDRQSRILHSDFVRLFKRTAAQLRREAEAEEPARAYLREAVLTAGVAKADQVDALVNEGVRAWRCTNRGAALPAASETKSLATILSMVYNVHKMSGSLADRVQAYADEHGLVPLKLVLTGRNKLALYAEVPTEQRDERLMPWGWVRRIGLTALKTKMGATGERLAWLTDKPDASEKELRAWPALAAWLHAFDEPFRPVKMVDFTQRAATAVSAFQKDFPGKGQGIAEDTFSRLLASVKSSPSKTLSLPIGALVRHSAEPHRSEQGKILGLRQLVVTSRIAYWLVHFGDAAQKAKARSTYIGRFISEEHAQARIDTPFEPRFGVSAELCDALHIDSTEISYYKRLLHERRRDATGQLQMVNAKMSLDDLLSEWMHDHAPADMPAGYAQYHNFRPANVFLSPQIWDGKRSSLIKLLDLEAPVTESPDAEADDD